jgi:hypothetical protein
MSRGRDTISEIARRRERRAVLLVVLGAGASYDYARDHPPAPPGGRDILNFRPPLTDALVNSGELSRSVLNDVPDRAASALVGALRGRPASVSLEQWLDQKIGDPEGDNARELLALRLYLQILLGKCSEEGLEEVSGVTNQAVLVRSIDGWRRSQSKPRPVLYVTFNYDSILDRALVTHFRWQPRSLEAYVDRDEFKLFKLHGSWNWKQVTGVRCEYDIPEKVPVAELRRALLDNARSFPGRLGEIVLSGGNQYAHRFGDGPHRLALPALAIPFGTKATFMCHPGHHAELSRLLPGVDHMLSIGWKGGEPHFLEMLKGIQGNATLRVVDPGDKTDLRRSPLRETLRSGGVPISDEIPGPAQEEVGFTDFIGSQLDAYLDDLGRHA